MTRQPLVVAALCLSAALASASPGRVVILALEGADARLTERWMAEGQLPNMAELAEAGGYARLEPPLPVVEPVVWSVFATGLDPGENGVLDELWRDPGDYRVEPSLCRESWDRFLWGPYTPLVLLGAGALLAWLAGFCLLRAVSRRWAAAAGLVLAGVGAVAGFWIGVSWVPHRRPRLEPTRSAWTFWDVAARAGVASAVVRVPATYPPHSSAGCALVAGPATPDPRGQRPRSTLFTSGLAHPRSTRQPRSTW